MKMHYSGLRRHGLSACGRRPVWHTSIRPERVTCRLCLRILRNIGQIADGKLRAAAAGEGGER